MYTRMTLPNGLRLLTCPMPHVRTATVGLYVAIGSRHEPAEKAGLSHFLEHMVFKGTAAYPRARDLSEAIEGVGGMLDASTSAEVTAYWAKVPAQHFVRAVDVLSEMVQRPRLSPAEIEKERRVIIEELHMVADSPADWVFELIGQELWPAHPLGRPIAGTPETVAAIAPEDLERYRAQGYLPQRLVAVVAGALPAEQVEATLGQALGGLPAQPFALQEAPPEPTPGARLCLEERDIEQANLCLALPALSYRHPDRFVQLLLETILGAGMSSRLFQSIREERALAYHIQSMVRQHGDAGALLIYAGVAPHQTAACLEAIWKELERLVQEEVPAAELARAKEFNKGRIALRMEDSYGVASWYAGQEILLGRIEEVDEVIACIDAVQPADVHRLAAELFRREQLRLAVVGPGQEEGTLRQALGI